MTAGVTAASLALLGAGCSSSAHNGTSGSKTTNSPTASLTHVNLGVAPGLNDLPLWVASKEGFWTKNGLNISEVPVTSGPEVAVLMVKGQVDVYLNTADNTITLKDKGFPVTAFGVATAGQAWDILVRNGYPLPNSSQGWKGVMQDLKGAKVGVIALGAAAENVAKTLFQQAGVSPTAESYIATGAVPTTLAALSQKQVDVAISYEPGLTEALNQHIATEPFSLRKGQGPSILQFPDLVMMTPSNYAQQHPNVLKDFRMAVQQADAYIANAANEPVLVDLLVSNLSLSPSVAKLVLANNKNAFEANTALTPQTLKQLSRVGQWLQQEGVTSKNYTVSTWTTAS